MIARARPATAVLALVIAACGSGGGDDPEAFCIAMQDATSATGAIIDLDLNDERAVETAIAQLETVRADAPDEIRDEATAVADTYAEVLRSLAAAAPQARNDVLRDLQPQLDEVSASAVVLQQYAETTCRIQFEGPAEPTPTPTPLGIED